LLDGNGVIFLAVHDGQIVGGFVGGITTDWQSDHKLAFDYVMYVMPKFRSSGVAKLLVETFICWAKNGCRSNQLRYCNNGEYETLYRSLYITWVLCSWCIS
jgi:GNAT superfamily N-acetyltransferase